MQQQLDTIPYHTIPSKPEATVSAYQYSPQYTTTIDSKMTRLEKRMEQLMKIVGNRPQESTGPKIAAYQPTAMQPADEELRYLQEQVRQLRGINSEDHFNAIAGYQPSTKEHNRSTSESGELQHLKEEIRLLKLAQRGPQQQQPQQFQKRMNYDSQDAFQERMMNEMRRIQARLDEFMRTHANRNNRQEQPRVRTREGHPVCDICGRVGHVKQNCYARVDQRNQRIAALEAEDTAEQVVAQFEHHKLIRWNQSSLNGDIGSTYPEHNSTIKADQSEHDAQSYNDLVSIADSDENNAVENVIQDSQVQETAETATKEPLASNSQTQEPTAEGPSSPENSYSACAAERAANTHIVIKPKDLSLLGTIADFPVKLLVDTGASITVLKGSLFRKIASSSSLTTTPSRVPAINTVSGERLPILEQVTFQLPQLKLQTNAKCTLLMTWVMKQSWEEISLKRKVLS